MQVKIILLGTGAGETLYIGANGINYIRHHASALFIITVGNKEHYVLIDATPFVADGLFRADIPFSKLDCVCISHSHEDHCNCYRELSAKLEIGHIKHRHDPEYSTKKLDVLAPGNVIEVINDMFRRKDCIFNKAIIAGDNIIYTYDNQRQKTVKEILHLWGVAKNTVMQIGSGNIIIKCIGVNHLHDSAFSDKGHGDTAFGFIISAREKDKQFNVLYLTDFDNYNLSESLKRDINGFCLDLCIIGAPIPFPDNEAKKRHMGLKNTLKLLKDIEKNGLIKKEAPIILTHLSDRWDIDDTVNRAGKVIHACWPEKKIWIPQKDDFTIIYADGKLKKKGRIIKI